MPVLKIVSYPAKIFRKGKAALSNKVILSNGEEHNFPRGYRFDLFRILLNRNKIFFMTGTRYDVYCDDESYALIEFILKKRGPSSVTRDDIEKYKTMSKEEIIADALPKVIADILLEE
jgi:hypothetical protein